MNIEEEKYFILDHLSKERSLIYDLIKKYHNDSDLGKKMRELYFNGRAKYKKQYK